MGVFARLAVTLGLALCAGGCSVATSPVSVWATNDGVRVNPETGRYMEDRTDIHADYPSGDYRRTNAVWDAGGDRISLRAARNEVASFQVVVEAAAPVSGVEARFDRLVGPGGREIPGRNLALFLAWYVLVEKPSDGYPRTSLGRGWYADALLPARDDGRLVFDIPNARNGVGPTQRNQTVWVDVHVPRDRVDAPPGDYAGEFSISWPGGRKRLQVALTVWDFALPDETHCRGDIWNGSLRSMAEDQELLWYQLLRRHRLQPGVAYYRPALKVEGAKVTIDWTAYDARLAKYLDGSAFTEKHGYSGPGYGVPLDHILLPFNCNRRAGAGDAWPVNMPETGPSPEFEQVWMETARQVREHLDARPETRRCGKVAFLGALDEARSNEAYEKMVYYSGLLRRGLGKEWFKFRVDGGYNSPTMEKLQPHVDLWVCHTAGFDEAKVSRFRRLGVEPWFYGPMIYERAENASCGSNTFTDLDLLTCRGVGWAAWRFRAGYCEWEFDAFYDDTRAMKRPAKPFDPAWTRAMNCRYGGKEYNGSGLLVYRGELAGIGKPIASIRLKAHRRGLQDYEYFHLLREAGLEKEADGLVNSVVVAVPFGRAAMGNVDIWKHDGEEWDKVRRRAGDLLHRLHAAP